MSSLTAPVRLLPLRRFGETSRRDAWWIQPLASSSWTVDLPRLRDVGGVPGRALHLRPVPLAVLFAGDSSATSPHSWFGPSPAAWPAWLPFSPALLILPIPAFFRLTCYYYRGAYYKAFWADPPSCTVGEPRSTLLGRALVSADPAERPSLHAVHLGWPCCDSLSSTCGRRCGSPIRRQAPSRSASASARSCWRPTSCCSAATSSAVIRCVMSSAAASTSSRARRSASRAYSLRQLPQPPAHAVGLVQPVHGWLR